MFELSEFSFLRAAWMPYAVGLWLILLALSVASYRGSRIAGWKRLLGVSARMLGIGLLLFCLLEPMMSVRRPKPQANTVAILVDNSRSLAALAASGAQASDVGGATLLDPLQQALGDDSDWLLDLSKDFRVRKYLFDQTITPVETLADRTGNGTSSSLHQAIRSMHQRYRGEPLAAIVLVTDGQATDDEPLPLDAASDLAKSPIFPVRLPLSHSHADLRLEQVTVRESDFETAPVTVTATVSQQGLAGDAIVVELRDSAGRVVRDETITLTAEKPVQSVAFRFRPEESGISAYRVVARLVNEPMEASSVEASSPATRSRELTRVNNQRDLVIDRGMGPYRILYVSGRPNWEFKFLRRALDEDAEIQLTSLIRIAKKEPKFSFRNSKLESTNPLFSGFDDVLDEEKENYDEPVFARLGVVNAGDLKKGFPKDAAELFAYSAVLIDDLESDFLTVDQQQMLRQFVSIRGGALIALGGQESMRGKAFRDSVLGQLLPVYGDAAPAEMVVPTGAEDFVGPALRFQLSREGWLLPWLRLFEREPDELARLQAMPAFHVWNRTTRVKPGSNVLVEGLLDDGDKVPLLMTQKFGRGTTAAFMLGDFWRWAMAHEGAGTSPLYQAWRQLVRAMIADVPEHVQIRTEVESRTPRIAKIVVDVRGEDFQIVDNAEVSLSLRGPDGETIQTFASASPQQPGEYVAETVMTESGVYRAAAAIRSPDGSELGQTEVGWVYAPEVKELSRIGIDEERLSELANASGGKVIPFSSLGGLSGLLPTDKIPVHETQSYPLWHRPWIVLLALASLIAEWRMRRSHGLA